MIERRLERRYSFQCPVQAARSADSTGTTHAVAGSAVNISAGGMCIASERFVDPGALIAVRVHVEGVPAALPVLMQVQWVDPPIEPGGPVRAGLRFVI